jgi:hypothetical protein
MAQVVINYSCELLYIANFLETETIANHLRSYNIFIDLVSLCGIRHAGRYYQFYYKVIIEFLNT